MSKLWRLKISIFPLLNNDDRAVSTVLLFSWDKEIKVLTDELEAPVCNGLHRELNAESSKTDHILITPSTAKPVMKTSYYQTDKVYENFVGLFFMLHKIII